MLCCVILAVEVWLPLAIRMQAPSTFGTDLYDLLLTVTGWVWVEASAIQVQKYVAEDMNALGQLKSAEDKASVRPQLDTSVWQQPPTPADLPEVDPALFMGNAPLRDADSLANFKETKGTTQLHEMDGSAGDSIGRAARRAHRELARLDQLRSRRQRKHAAASVSPSEPIKLDTSAVRELDGAALADGEHIRHMKQPVGVVRVPLGGNQVPAALLGRFRGMGLGLACRVGFGNWD